MTLVRINKNRRSKLRKIEFIILLKLIFIQALIGQSESVIQITKVFDEYRSYVEQKEYDKAFSYYLDSFLLYMPIDQLKKQFTDLDNDKISYSVSDSKLIFISEMIKGETTSYAFLKYGSNYHYTFKKKADKEYISRIQNMFKNQYRDNYSYSKKNKQITFYKEQELIAINKGLETKFILYKEKLNPYMSIWIQDDIFNELLLKRKSLNMLKQD